MQEDRQSNQAENREDWQKYGEDMQDQRMDYADDNYYGGVYRGGAPLAAAAVTGAVIGSTMTAASFSTISSDCGYISMDGVTYYQCGPTWYQPTYQGDQVIYVVVKAP
jgi:hypothetical protein